MHKNSIIILIAVMFLFGSDTSKTISTYKNGNVSHISYFKEDIEKGKQIIRQETFHFTGSKAMEGNIKDDYKIGLWTYYYQDGTKRLEGNYSVGQKDGLWTSYNVDESGSYISKTIYANGIKIKN